ncbi:3-isopropylmalate dehydratase small subunit [Kitasatospora sp. NBC_00374]|uniref:3-isopropylmalate dehydratase small subunit n=1 Tax=Kitasatospora sp. NBC_00374 TaxID=2975964 RepID=UPI0030E1F731
MEKFTVHTGTAAPLKRSNVDTDQIIPARFCVHSTRTGHAASLFADWREDPTFVLNRPEHHQATILVAGNDFGTGSSREYAVWALQDHGFRAVVAPRFGDIFRGNALMNGLLTVTAPPHVVETLWNLIDADPTTPLTVDLHHRQLRCEDLVHPIDIDDDTRTRLLQGLDPIAATLQHAPDITAYEHHRRPALPHTH